MSYTTRCPACGTTFKVVPDQLKISDGWVRCGHCADVFDATLYLQAWTPPPVPATAPAAEPPAPVSVREEAPAPTPDPHHVPPPDPLLVSVQPSGRTSDDAPVWGDTAPADLGGGVGSAAPADTDAPSADALIAAVDRGGAAETGTMLPAPPAQGAQSESESESNDAPMDPGAPSSMASEDERATDFHAELTRFAETSGRSAVSVDAVEPPAVAPAHALPDAQMPDEAMGVQDTTEPGFVRQARRRAFWRSPSVRAALAVLAVLLGGLLGAQWAVHERDALAASHPELAPLLSQLCAPLGCEIGPVRRIDAVVIDSATLARRLGNFYAFDVVIKNTAAIPVAVPALELSLTDTRDSVIARRVFLQSELPGAPTLLPPQGSLPLSLRLSITDAGAVPMAGYRALVFYP